jgi:hypothetical protein
MTSDTVSVRFAPGQPRVRLRELTGTEERAVTGTSTADALGLIDALLLAEPGATTPPPRAEDLVAADRDRLLVAIYRRAFGDRIENTLTCARCDNRFDIDFSLESLTATLERPRSAPSVRTVSAGTFETEHGVKFRLPTGRDERALSALPSDEAERRLLRDCIVEGNVEQIDGDALQDLFAEVAPLVDLTLDARCPECHRAHAVHFDIQTYLLSALIGDQRRLQLEVHRLALAYGWSLADILSLRRSERRHFVELIENEFSRHRRSPI